MESYIERIQSDVRKRRSQQAQNHASRFINLCGLLIVVLVLVLLYRRCKYKSCPPWQMHPPKRDEDRMYDYMLKK